MSYDGDNYGKEGIALAKWKTDENSNCNNVAF